MSKNVKQIPMGSEFGRLVTVSAVFPKQRRDGRNRAWVTVRCICGTTKDVMVGNLLSGNTTSCGCLHRELVKEAMTTHGHSSDGRRTRLLRIWKGMKERCGNPKARNYRWYGGKGILYAPEWERFEPFMVWALANGYNDGLELDRIDADKNYEPSNCRWVTKKANLRNRDFAWDEELDARLVAYAAEHGKSPYEVIRTALERLLEEEVIS